MKAVVVCDSFGPTPQWVIDDLKAAGLDAAAKPCKDAADLAEHAADAQLIWLVGSGTDFPPQALEQLPECVAIIRSGSGVDNVPVEEATRRNIMVVNTPEATAGPVAEGTAALILSAYRRLPLQDRLMRQGVWGQWDHWPHAPLEGQTLGLVGFGHIARRLAECMSGFRMNLLVSDPVVDASVIQEFGGRKVELDELLRESDIISLHCPLIDSTRGLINADTLGKMKPTAILINAARGGVVNEVDLVEAMRNNTIAVAALDAYQQEPLPADHPLTTLDNVILNPHSTAHQGRIAEDFRRRGADAIIAMAQGRWPISCINRSRITPRLNLQEAGVTA